MGDPLQHGEHGVVFAQNAANGRCGVNAQRLQFAQEQKSEDVIDIGVGENCACDGTLPDSVAYFEPWLKFGSGFDLAAEVG